MQSLVILPGWSAPQEVFAGLTTALSKSYQVSVVDLQAFKQEFIQAATLKCVDALLAAIAVKIPDNAIVFGWSLGGMLAIKIANNYPHKIRHVITCATNLRFTQTANYQSAMPATTFNDFKRLLGQDVGKCLQQFRYLVAKGGGGSKQVLQYLNAVYSKYEFDKDYLMASLVVLGMLDLTDAINIDIPSVHIYGENDVLVPEQVSQLMQTGVVMKSAGHAPFLDDLEQFLGFIRSYLVN
ncbi:alpha/beta fold hydrolase [Gammaproteobacteria bacterium]|nr:alpha/beta fold hydrolase [Gammaproteobacteria bacterium]